MKIWTLIAKYGYLILETYTCFCNKNPSKLLTEDKEYSDTLRDLENNLFDDFGYLFVDDLIDRDTEGQEEDNFDNRDDEMFNNFVRNLNYKAYEVDCQEADNILIDERNNLSYIGVYFNNTFLCHFSLTDEELLSPDKRGELLEPIWNKYYAPIFNRTSEEDEKFENKCFNNFLDKIRIEICKSQAPSN